MELSQLTDFHPYNTGLDQPILALMEEYAQAAARPLTPCQPDQFLALLAGVPALRKTPGIPGLNEVGPDYFTTLPKCATQEDATACRAHLEKVFGITDKQSLRDFCNKNLRCHSQYLDFEGFWEGHPPFSLSDLRNGALEFFQVARDFSAQFYAIVGRHGFLGWDISECVGHLRAAYACGILSREELDELASYWITQAQTFRSWPEYAASLVCGELYWDFRQQSRLPQLQEGQRLWLRLVRSLLDNENAWGGGLWYAPPRKRDYAIREPDFRPLLRDWQGPDGCLATDHITVLGMPVGWCYREEPDGKFPDSGWRFFSGQEDDNYVNDLEHTDAYSLNTICNYDPDILPLLSAPWGSAFARGADGKFHAEPFPSGRG